MKKSKYTELRGILTGVPEGTTLPAGKYIYQKTKPGLGNIPGDKTRRLQVRRWTVQTNPRTAAQREARMAFRLGVTAWKKKSESEKEAWRAPGLKLGLNRFQAFMRDWMKTYWSEKMAILLDAGEYLPQITALTNCTIGTVSTAKFSRIGDIVSLSFQVPVTKTDTAGESTFTVSLPLPSDIQNTRDCTGSGAAAGATIEPVIGLGNVADNTMRCVIPAIAQGTYSVRCIAQYIIR